MNRAVKAAFTSSYYRARYYEPNTGRFLSEDPLGFVEGGNFFRYAANSPLNFGDPSGLSCKPRCNIPVPEVLDKVVDTIMGEQSPDRMEGHHQYQYGDAYGHPTGPVITEETLDSESYLIASSMVNRGNQGGMTLDEVISRPSQYIAYTGSHDRVDAALWSEEGSHPCRSLQRALDALMSALSDPADYRNYRAQLIPAQGRTPTHVVNFRGSEWIGRSVFGINERH